MTACSDFSDEPLAGTAAQATRWVCVEYPGGWGRDALDGEALGAELAQALTDLMNRADARFQFIRTPGRAATNSVQAGHRVLIANSSPDHPRLTSFRIDTVADLLTTDLTHPPHATELTTPVILVCTHGKRDVCCALKGRPIAAELAEHAKGATTSATVFETSHTGGHRFAPALIVLPWGLTYGRVDAAVAQRVYDAALSGRVELGSYRGRSAWDKASQAAEVFVRSHFSLTGIGDVVDVEEAAPGVLRVMLAGGDAVDVATRQQTLDLPPRPESCGKGNKPVTTYVCELA